jgi:hypothetical protein
MPKVSLEVVHHQLALVGMTGTPIATLLHFRAITRTK